MQKTLDRQSHLCFKHQRLVHAVSMMFFLLTSRAFAQQAEITGQASSADSISALRTILEEKRNDRARLERMLNALNTVDSVYRIRYPAWVVLDEDLRQRIYKAFRGRFASVPRDTAVIVIANPADNEILQILIGSVVMGPRETATILSDSLRKDILAANYALHEVDLAPPKQRKRILFGAKPLVVSIDASVFGGSLLFGNGWGLELKMGHDEIGYPFWSSGEIRLMAVFDRLKFGVMVPLKIGQKEPVILEPLAIRPRKLNGSTGISAQFDQPVGSDFIGARFTVGELNKFASGQLTNDTLPYYLHTVGQLFYSHEMALGEEHLLTVSAGAGYHQIALGEVHPDRRIVAIEKFNFFSPIIRMEYVHRGNQMYGVSAQYYNSLVWLSGWIELVRNFLYVDLRYASPVVRSPQQWEQHYFYMVSPRFRLVY